MRRPMRPNEPRRVVHSLDELPAICDCGDVAVYLRLNPEVVARMVRDGIIHGAKQGQAWRFRKTDILDYECRLLGPEYLPEFPIGTFGPI